jgi:hypothetical protein
VRLFFTTAGSGINFLPTGPGAGGSSVDLWAYTSAGYDYANIQHLFVGQGSQGTYGWNASLSGTNSMYLDTMSTWYIEDIGPISGSVPVADPTPAWIAMPLVNGWGAYGGLIAPQYRKLGDMVQLRGTVQGGTADTICTLPVGYRPPGFALHMAWLSDNNSTIRAATRLEVQGDGRVIMNSQYGTSGLTLPIEHLSFDGISFSVTP